MFVSSAICRAIQVADGPHRENGSGVNWRALHFTISPEQTECRPTTAARQPAHGSVTRPVLYLALENSTVPFRSKCLSGNSHATPCVIGTRLKHSVSNGLNTWWLWNNTFFTCTPKSSASLPSFTATLLQRCIYRLMAIMIYSGDSIWCSAFKQSQKKAQRCLLSV